MFQSKANAPARVAVLVVALAALIAFAAWFARLPVATDPRSSQLPMLPTLVFLLGARSSAAIANAVLAAIAATGIAACVLSIVLNWRSGRQDAPRRLAAALALISLSVAYFFFTLPFEPYRALVAAWPRGATRVGFDLVAYLALAAGLWQLGRFFEIYPRPIRPDDWRMFVQELRADDLRKVSEGWRARVYGKKAKQEQGRASRAIYWEGWQGPHAGNAVAAVLFAAAILLPFTDLYERGIKAGPAGHDAHVAIFALMVGLATTAFLYAGTRNFRMLQFHHRHGLPDDRLRIEWIYSTTLVGSLFALGMILVGMIVFVIVTMTAGEAGARYSGLFMLVPFTLAVPVFAISFLVAVTLSIFYRGAVDPRLMARKVTVWWMLGAVVAVLFILVERAVAVRIAQWLGWPADTGLLLAGAVVTATVAPVRKQAESSITALVGRFLPLEHLVDGERKRAAVAMCDLSGYTALAVRDEKQALLVGALLHRKAAVIAQAHGGHMVKSIGDAVMLEFPDADGACAALTQLHAEFPAACRTMGFEPLPLHSGAHVGDVVVGHDKDLYGHTVNLAARLQDQAKGGQIVVSGEFLADRRSTSGEWRALGPRRLKNIPEAVDCHEMVAAE